MSTELQHIDAPTWTTEMEFCHICDDNDQTFCGRGNDAGYCEALYWGEAICPSCGCPTCPQCALLSDLDDRLED